MPKKIALVTAGPTREYLDPVRYLSNGSSGKMGIEIAQAFKRSGFDVVLIMGPGISAPSGIKTVSVVSALDMQAQVKRRFPSCDIFVSAAAVSDFRPRLRFRSKIHRSGKTLQLDLISNPDILYEAGRRKARQIVVGFALEDFQAVRRARKKMNKKNCDLMVLNGPETIDADKISAALIQSGGKIEKLGRITKKAAAKKICQAILKILKTKS